MNPSTEDKILFLKASELAIDFLGIPAGMDRDQFIGMFVNATMHSVLSVSVCNSPIAGRTGWLRRQPVAPVRVEGHHGVA